MSEDHERLGLMGASHLLLSDGLPEVFSAAEIACAAGVPVSRVRELMAQGEIRSVAAFLRSPATPLATDAIAAFVPRTEAIRAARALAHGTWVIKPESDGRPLDTPRDIFSPPPRARRSTRLPLILSTALHAGVLAAALTMTALDLTSTSTASERQHEQPEKLRLVYLALPGPGGGGGGGGLRQPAPPPKALRKGRRTVSSPLPARQAPPPIVPVEKPAEPKPTVLNAEQLPPIVAPIVVAPADTRDRVGVLAEAKTDADSHGPGAGGGVGHGTGTGIGEGEGPGVGPGSGGGTGGGPYRPGSGIDPPRLLREVKPDYTEEGRRLGIEGDVVLEIVVRRDGAVGEVRILQGLGAGLEERAAQAVRQWRFAPARRLGAAVDVIVEVAVEFKLR